MSGFSQRVLVTGASGFIGAALLERLVDSGFQPLAALRDSSKCVSADVPVIYMDGLLSTMDWSSALWNVQCVIHAAARVHVMRDQASDPLKEFRKVNVEGTLELARQAAEAGVRRFIFISSIKVNGECTELGRAYTADDVPAPIDPYGISKLEAEQGLFALAVKTGMEVVIIRPVLVYGPGVKANFRNMMSWLDRGIPLPLGAIHNKRSLVALDNLVDLIVTCIDHPAAANQVFLASDGEDLSTVELLMRLGGALGKPARLLPVPAAWLKGVACLLGRRGIAMRLCGSLVVDIEKTRRLLDWTPPVRVSDALNKTARHFLEGTQ